MRDEAFRRAHVAPARIVLSVLPPTFLALTSEGAISPILPLYAAGFGAGAMLTGIVVAAYGIARIALSFPAGYFSDRVGRRLLMVSGPALAALASALAAWSDNLEQLIIYRFVSGAGLGLALTGAIILLNDISDSSNRGRIMSLYRLSILGGLIVGPPIGGFAAAMFDLSGTFLLAAALNGAGAVWAYILVPASSSRLKATTAPEAEEGRTDRGGGLLSAINLNLLLVSLISFNSLFIVMGARVTVMPLLADERIGLGTGTVGVAFMLTSLTGLLLLVPAGSLADRLGRKRLIFQSTLVAGGSLVLLALSYDTATFMAAAIVMGLGMGLGGPAPAAYAGDVSPPSARGTALGLYQTLSDLGLIAGPLLMGALVEVAGFTGALGFNAAFTVAAGLLFWVAATESTVSSGTSVEER